MYIKYYLILLYATRNGPHPPAGLVEVVVEELLEAVPIVAIREGLPLNTLISRSGALQLLSLVLRPRRQRVCLPSIRCASHPLITLPLGHRKLPPLLTQRAQALPKLCWVNRLTNFEAARPACARMDEGIPPALRPVRLLSLGRPRAALRDFWAALQSLSLKAHTCAHERCAQQLHICRMCLGAPHLREPTCAGVLRLDPGNADFSK